MSEVFDVPKLDLGTYEHYKGKRYNVIGVARHTEVDEYFVVYSPLYEHEGLPDIWVRPYAMFTETIQIDNKIIPRFKKVE